MMDATRTWHAIPLLLTALSVGGWGGKPERPADTRPEWRSAAIDGIAPLMSTREVAAALMRHGYVETLCTSGGGLLAHPLDEAGHPCFRSAGRSTTVSLFFLKLNEGRRLAVVNFHWFELPNATDAKRLAVSSTIAKHLPPASASRRRPTTSCRTSATSTGTGPVVGRDSRIRSAPPSAASSRRASP